MEKGQTSSPEIVVAPFGDLIDLIVEDARASVVRHETRDERIEGFMHGLNRCAEMRGLGVTEFELELTQMQAVTKAMKREPLDTEQASKDYWHQRCATGQVEYCYEILRAAHYARHGHLPDANRKDLSASAVVRYNALAPRLSLNPIVARR